MNSSERTAPYNSFFIKGLFLTYNSIGITTYKCLMTETLTKSTRQLLLASFYK